MLILDTDHLSHFDEATAAGARLRERLLASAEDPAATITIVNGATLLTRNSNDFARIPGLRFENWLD